MRFEKSGESKASGLGAWPVSSVMRAAISGAVWWACQSISMTVSSIWLETAQRRQHFGAEELDGTLQVLLGHRPEVQLRQQRVEHPFLGRLPDVGSDLFGGTHEDQLVVDQVIGIGQVA